MNCCGCLDGLKVGEAFFECSKEACGKLYHQSCIMSPLKVKDPDTWLCPECRFYNSYKKKDHSCDVPANSPNVTLRRIPGSLSRQQLVNHHASPAKPGVSIASQFCCTAHDKTLNSFPLTNSYRQHTTPGSDEITCLRNQMTNLTMQLETAVTTIANYQTALQEAMGNFQTINEKLKHLELRHTCKCQCCSETVSPAVVDLPPKVGSMNSVPTATESRSPARTYSAVVANVESAMLTLSSTTPADIERRSQTTSRDEATVKTVIRRPTSLCGTADPAKVTLKAKESRKHLHLWNMDSNVDEVRDYVHQLCPSATCSIEELKPKGDYKSYKIGVPEVFFKTVFSSDVWPLNAKIKPWVNHKRSIPKPSNQQTLNPLQQPFRGSSAS